MKDKILFLIIGILIGAMVTTGVFMIINKNNSQNMLNRGNLRNFDLNNLPEGFDLNNLPAGGAGGRWRTDGNNAGTGIIDPQTESM